MDVAVRDLKAKLSAYLQQAAAGERITVTDRGRPVAVLGPIHGFFFVALIGLCVYGCVERWWGWWFPLVVVITGGPIGSLIGDWIIRDRLKGKAA
mgnify:CR=1 FL=1